MHKKKEQVENKDDENDIPRNELLRSFREQGFSSTFSTAFPKPAFQTQMQVAMSL